VSRKQTAWRDVAYGCLGAGLLLAFWEIVGATGIGGLTIPHPAAVLAVYRQPALAALLARSARATLKSAVVGFALGTLLGFATALAAHLVLVLRAGLDRLAVVVNAIPAIALGPIFVIVLGRERTPAVIAALPTFFIIYVAASTGLRTCSHVLADLMTTFGARPAQRLIHLELPSAVPALLSGMKVSVTAAMIGTLVGEWFGAPKGLGVVMLNTLENFQVPLMWATILIAVSISLAGYGLLTVAERWAERRFS
jgi:ABC-type nitrate/sulfonate/bicarbonate transport system permease component